MKQLIIDGLTGQSTYVDMTTEQMAALAASQVALPVSDGAVDLVRMRDTVTGKEVLFSLDNGEFNQRSEA